MFLSPKIIYNIFYIGIISLNSFIIFKLLFNYKLNKNYFPIFVISLFLVLLLGLRPLQGVGIGQYFGDTVNYYNSFFNKYNGSIFEASNDIGFAIFTKFFVNYLNVNIYFFTLFVLYIAPVYFAIKRLPVDYKLIVFIMFISSFLFYSNGVNGIRSGIGSSFILLGMAFNKKQFYYTLFSFIIAISFHKSMLLPAFAFFLTHYFNNTSTLIVWWFSSIILSLTLGSYFSNIFSVFEVVDKRFTDYFEKKYEFENAFRYTGFRWDFVLFSASAVYMGWKTVIKKQITDSFYKHLFNTYLIANSFWILVIRSNFSNRFAALSWFLIPIILIYPLVKYKIFNNQKLIIAIILLGNLIFTLIMK